jgi:hypothetical protein
VRTLSDAMHYYWWSVPLLTYTVLAVGLAASVGIQVLWGDASTSVTNRAMADTIISPARNSNESMSRCDLPSGGRYRCCT